MGWERRAIILARASSSFSIVASVGPFLSFLQREGVVAAMPASRQMAAMGTPLCFALAYSWVTGLLLIMPRL